MPSPLVLTVTLNPSLDKTYYLNKFVVGSEWRAQRKHSIAGGKGINVARVLSELKIPVTTTGFLGGTNGQWIEKQLYNERLANAFVRIKGETRCNITIQDPKNTTRVLELGPQIHPKELSELFKQFTRIISKVRYLVLSGSLPLGVPSSVYARLIAEAHRHNVLTVLDTSGEPLAAGVAAKPFMVKPNLKEAEEFCGTKLTSPAKIGRALQTIHSKGVGIVIISLGAKGAVMYDGKTFLEAKARKVKIQNTVGCGDALVGGFIAAHAAGRSLEECLKLSVLCGTFVNKSCTHKTAAR